MSLETKTVNLMQSLKIRGSPVILNPVGTMNVWNEMSCYFIDQVKVKLQLAGGTRRKKNQSIMK